MGIELILLENVDDLGLVGDKVRVADGYARNFLLPRKLATPVTMINMRQLEVRKAKALEEYEKERNKAEGIATKLIELSAVTVMANASDEQKLFGSVTNIDIAEALTTSGFDIDRRKIFINTPIKTLGLFDFKIKLHQDVTVDLKVLVSKA